MTDVEGGLGAGVDEGEGVEVREIRADESTADFSGVPVPTMNKDVRSKLV